MAFQSLRRLSWFVALTFAPGLLFASELTGIRLSSGPTATRVVLDLSGAASHRLFELAEPDRIVIDLAGTVAGRSLDLPAAAGRVSAVRTGIRPGGELRVVLELAGPADTSSFALAPEGAWGHRLVIDIADPETAASHRTQAAQDQGKIVVIDAGHGGKDSGAIGRSGIKEKDVVLDIARRLAAFVEQVPSWKPVLVRRDDTYVDLDDRLVIAREARADFFISIHADSNKNRNVRGATVYSIQPRRAAAEQRQRLANRATADDLIGGVSLADYDEIVAHVLLDLTQNASRGNSIVAGERMIEQLSRVVPMLRDTVQDGSYAVLTSPDIPSLLVETSFVSNPRDEAGLSDASFRNRLAEALFAGLLDYYGLEPNPDTYLARNEPAEIHHVISRGETLSEIAERYRISLRDLRRTNRISGDVIRIGQVLTIPTF